MMEKSIYIINGIGTDVGKTFITSLLIKEEILKGNYKFCVLKPVASGVFDPFQSDTGLLLKAAGIPLTYGSLQNATLYFLKEPVSINIAANLEQIALNYRKVEGFCIQKIEEGIKHGKTVFIEMAGGLCSPLTDKKTMLELTQSLTKKFQKYCVNILVSTDYLGCISHTLLCHRAFNFDEIIWNPRNQGNDEGNDEIKKTIEGFTGKSLRSI